MQGLVDVLTDVLFCLSLAYESVVAAARLRAADEEEAAARLEAALSPLFFASAACIAASVLFNFTATLWLYFSRGRGGDHLARTVFSVDASSHHKLFFFLVIMLAALVNIRLAALLPWKKEARRTVLVRIQKLYLAGKCIEDLPQLTIAAVYLVQRSSSGELAGASVGTAVLQVVISGASFLLTLIWLCLQVADSARMRSVTVRRFDESTLPSRDSTLTLEGEGGGGDGGGAVADIRSRSGSLCSSFV